MRSTREGRKIGLLHHIGGGNLGDDATQAAVIQNIRSRWPDAVIVGFTMSPSDTENRHGIRAYPLRRRQWDLGATSGSGKAASKGSRKGIRGTNSIVLSALRGVYRVAIKAPRGLCQEIAFLFRSFRTVKTLDLLIVNGGGQLTEWGGPWGFPYTIFKWVGLARVAKVRRVFLNVGAGPLTQPLSQYFVRKALRQSDYVSFRDTASQALVRRIGYDGPSQVFPDSAYGLAIPDTTALARDSGDEKACVGLAPLPYGDPRSFPERDQALYDGVIGRLGQFGAWLVGAGYRVALFGSDIGTDPRAIEDLEHALRCGDSTIEGSSRVTIERLATLDDLLACISRMDYVVTCRFHGVVFAHLLNKPVLAVSHHPKMATLMNDLGLGRYCIDIRTFDLNTVTRAFIAVVDDAEKIRESMAQHLSRFRLELAGQLDGLFPRAIVQ